jgi:hypothetical protein
MIICPLDLRVCEHPLCGGGLCEMSASLPLVVCWDCGSVSEESTSTLICVDCLLTYRQSEAKAES